MMVSPFNTLFNLPVVTKHNRKSVTRSITGPKLRVQGESPGELLESDKEEDVI